MPDKPFIGEGGSQDHAQATQGTPRPRRRLLPLVQIAALCALGVFIIRELSRGLGSVDWSAIRPDWLYVAASLLLTGVSMVFSATAYRATLASVGVHPPWPVMLAATWISRLGKYLPGKVFSVAGLAWILSRRGISGATATGMVLINAGLGVIVGFVVAGPMLIMDPIRSYLPQAWVWTAAVVVAGLIAIHPAVFFPIMNRVLARLGRPPLPLRPRLLSYIRPAVHLLAQWVLLGLALWLLCASVTVDGQPAIGRDRIGLCISLSALAVTLGFVVLVSPGGLGVREAVYLLVLGPVIGPGPAAVVTVGMRLAFTVVELLLAGVGLGLLRAYPPEAVARCES